MFTGLVQVVGKVAAQTPRGDGAVRLLVDPCGWGHRPEVGESISVNGCCLTVAEPVRAGGPLAFDVVPETLRRTTLGGLAVGVGVNLERSLAAADLMGGHLVQGHIDGVGVVERVDDRGGDHRLRIRPPVELMVYLVPKGAVTVEGVSLTVAGVDVGGGTFEVALIPTTLEKTTLGSLRAGDRCNLESDVMARTVVHYLRHYGGK